jgi:hypothetical protein
MNVKFRCQNVNTNCDISCFTSNNFFRSYFWLHVLVILPSQLFLGYQIWYIIIPAYKESNPITALDRP